MVNEDLIDWMDRLDQDYGVQTVTQALRDTGHYAAVANDGDLDPADRAEVEQELRGSA